MKTHQFFSNQFFLFSILSTFKKISLKVFKKICKTKASSNIYGEGLRRSGDFWNNIERHWTRSICLRSIFTGCKMRWNGRNFNPKKRGGVTPQFLLYPLLNLSFIPDHNSGPNRNLYWEFIWCHKSVNSSSRQSCEMKHLRKSNESKKVVLSQIFSFE